MNLKPGLTFVSRQPPGSVGGIQRHGKRLMELMEGSFETSFVNWRGPDWAGPFVLYYLYWLASRESGKVVHLDDGATALMADWFASPDKAYVATVHGRELLFPIPAYQSRLRRSLARLDTVVCVSKATAREVLERGVSPDRIEVIPNVAEVVKPTTLQPEELLDEVRRECGLDLAGKRVLFSLGRPILRKGFDFFAREVAPHLPSDCVYLVAGPAKRKPALAGLLERLLSPPYYQSLELMTDWNTVHPELVKLAEHPQVHYLNNVSERLRDLLFWVSDLFVMPNRRVPYDMEGFGIVALEAAVRKVPVLATGIEGITDAVIEGENGYCLPENDPAAWLETIRQLLDNSQGLAALKDRARDFTLERFSPQRVQKMYEGVFQRELANRLR